ncbi:MAG: DJ-1/PfpI family protein [Treponema sp.]|jgi:4-methyl-5(b-hydroxyethyl)-thiazole monophosphate biosynthesis|nr:DJ-1/PfpI family protein [Treponema sp.]
MAKHALVFLADGFEEVEAITPIDYLRRAGIEVTTCSVGASVAGGQVVKGSHGIVVQADRSLAVLEPLKAADWDAALLPGGIPGAPNLAASEAVSALLRDMALAGKLVCAICASPAVVLFPLGLLKGRRFTCYPGMETEVKEALWSEERVVVDGNLITSRGAGTAADWAIAIISKLVDEGTANAIAAKVVLN